MKLLMKKRASKPNPSQETKKAKDSTESNVPRGHSPQSAETEPPASSEFRAYPGITVHLRPGTAKLRWEVKFEMPDGRVKKSVDQFVDFHHEIDSSDPPRRKATWYPLDPAPKKKKRRS